jgi:hypothetical protein
VSRGLSFPYKRIDGRLRPIIPIEITHKAQSIRYEVLVDSGADTSIIPGDIGRAIGIDVESGDRFELGGVTGENRIGYFHRVTLRIGKYSYQTKVGFMNNMREGSFGMVGQKGFFDRFAIKFDYAERKLILHKKQWV